MQECTSASDREVAIEHLFRTHYGLMRDYGLKLAANDPLVKDAIQDVFLALLKGEASIAEIAFPKGYLLTALRRRILERQSAQKSRRRRNQRHAECFPSFSISQEALLISEELRAEQQDQLGMALERLPDRRKEALYLRFRHGLTYDEIASVMAIQPQTARNYVFKALQFLRQQPFLKPFLRPTGTWL